MQIRRPGPEISAVFYRPPICGLAARPPLSTERLSLLPDGRLRYRLKRRWSDGTTHVIYEPMELMERLAALVPPPRFNITRFYGVASEDGVDFIL